MEVALVLALVALVVLGAVKSLGGGSSSKLGQANDGIRTESASGAAVGDGGAVAPGDGASEIPPTSTSSTTTRPPTTTSTTAPHVTTTSTIPTTTTTTGPPVPWSAAMGNGESHVWSSTKWVGTATVGLHLPNGVPVSTTITVRVRTKDRRGVWTQTDIQVALGADGTADLTAGPFNRSGSSRVTQIEFVVIDVQEQQGYVWDGDQRSISIDPP